MSFQKCPICQGSGKKVTGYPMDDTCDVCCGAGIIDDLTGLPPKEKTQWTPSAKSTDIEGDTYQ